VFRGQVAGEHPTPVQSGGEAWRQVIQVPASNDYSKSQAARRQIPGILAGDNFFCSFVMAVLKRRAYSAF
jgi:hypothetical protein